MDKIKSYAKVNIGLQVINKKKNGYHTLKMIMTEIDLFDEIVFSESNELIVETDRNVCLMKENLCYKVANYLKNLYKIPKGIKIYIKKNIPDGGGLGGGSSNAAAVLKYLNEKWELNLSKDEMKRIGFRFGCDIPYFIEGGLCLVKGFGEKVKRIKSSLVFENILVVIPPFKNKTADVFKNHKKKKGSPFRNLKLMNGMKVGSFKKFIFNDLQDAADTMNNGKITEIIEMLKKEGFKNTIMSGSGSTIISYIGKNNLSESDIKNLKYKLGDCEIIISKLKMYSY